MNVCVEVIKCVHIEVIVPLKEIQHFKATELTVNVKRNPFMDDVFQFRMFVSLHVKEHIYASLSTVHFQCHLPYQSLLSLFLIELWFNINNMLFHKNEYMHICCY